MSARVKEALDRAADATGLSDFGDMAFVAGLEALLDAAEHDSDLGEAGRRAASATVQDLLVKRLKLYADRAAYPEIAAQHIAAPLIVAGLPRSGTTFLHALLAQDPATRSPLSWQLLQPSPPPHATPETHAARIAASRARQAQIPDDFKRMHLIGPELPEECNAFTTLAFHSANLAASFAVPDYVRWYLGADDAPAYALHLHMLQHLQAFGPSAGWVLKSPPHMFHMARLIETYPDAQIVFPHRDPGATLASLSSLIAYIRRGQCARVDDVEVGREMLEFWSIAIDRIMAFRADPAQADRFVDISYRTLVADPMAAVTHVYAATGRHLSGEAEAAMRRFLADRPKDSHGVHRYTAEQFGLNRDLIRERLAGYVATHLAAEDSVTA
ncbi:MAG: sulfotransferase [Sphingobium sp.]